MPRGRHTERACPRSVTSRGRARARGTTDDPVPVEYVVVTLAVPRLPVGSGTRGRAEARCGTRLAARASTGGKSNGVHDSQGGRGGSDVHGARVDGARRGGAGAGNARVAHV